MSRKILCSTRLLKPRVPLSHAVSVGKLIFTSGITPFSKDGSISKDNFGAQMRQVMENLKAVLQDLGSSLDKIIKVNIILARNSDFDEMNQIYSSYFEAGRYPARTTIQASLAHPKFLLEIECVAEI